jgi:hypothetical protein
MAQKNTITKIFLGAALFLGAFLSGTHGASAASLYLTPSTGSYLTNHTFTVGIYVSSPDIAMNAAQGTVAFPADKLEVLSISKTDSVVNLWVQEPSFSNRDGAINFGGVVVNPGFQGVSGKILGVTFQVKKPGTAAISFSAGSVLANDGKGTNILQGMKGATMALAAPSLSEGGTAQGNTAPSSLMIIANPAVKEGEWYNIDTISFTWSLPAGTGGVNYAISNDPGYGLLHNPQGPVTGTSYDLTKFNDGEWYFYLSSESDGVWLPVTRLSFQLDRTPPEPFTITQKNDNLTVASQNPVFQWAATDNVSGIAYYKARIGDGDWFDPSTLLQGSLYVLPPQSSTRSRTLTVRAYDRAGNSRASSINFHIGQTCSGTDAIGCAVSWFFTGWNWLWALDAAIGAALLSAILYHFFRWKKVVQKELLEFKGELRRDLRRLEEKVDIRINKGAEVDLSPSHLADRKESLEKATKRIEGDIQEEIKKIEKL